MEWPGNHTIWLTLNFSCPQERIWSTENVFMYEPVRDVLKMEMSLEIWISDKRQNYEKEKLSDLLLSCSKQIAHSTKMNKLEQCGLFANWVLGISFSRSYANRTLANDKVASDLCLLEVLKIIFGLPYIFSFEANFLPFPSFSIWSFSYD